MKRIVLATQNENKLQEMRAIFRHYNIQIVCPPCDFNPIETGHSFEDNAYIKAREASLITGMTALADDSGLQIEALDNAPGVYSARYAQSDKEKIQKVLNNLKQKANRKAQFVCSMILTDKTGEILHSTTGICKGEIIQQEKGDNGFGYDPIFLVSQMNKTMAELTLSEKNQISHRSIALKSMLKFIESERKFP